MRRLWHFLAHRWWMIAAGIVSLGAVFALALFLGKIPVPEAVPAPQSSKVLASDGQLIGLLHGQENRTIVPLAKISEPLQQAVVATEDRGFYHHPGVSVRGIARALWANVRGRRISQGGSTITQQYVRNAFEEIGRQRTVFRKMREAALAVKLERKHSKEKILEFYLNTVYFGRGAYGAEAAAHSYFGKSAAELTVSESAYLAGVIRSPENYKTEAAAAGIRNRVIDDMVIAGSLQRTEAETVKKEPFKFSFGSGVEVEPVKAAYFFEYVRRLLKAPESAGGFGLTDRELLSGGLEIHTTLDMRMQNAAENAIATTLDRPDDPEAALVAMDTQGNIKAMVGGREFTNLERARGFNFAYQKGGAVGTGGRQAGSTFKPFTLAAFLEDGKSIESQFKAPAKIVIPSAQCKEKDGKLWEVENFDHEDLGQINLIDATAKSVNTVYAQVVDLIRPTRVKLVAEKIGGFTGLEPVCSIALGTSGVTTLEMSRAFATFAARGDRPDVLAVTQLVAPGGREIANRLPKKEHVLDTNIADTVNLALQAVIKSGTGRRLQIGRPAGGKTGTTENHVDAWFVGYTPQLVAAVWMGFPLKDGKIQEMTNVRGIEVVGSSFPGTIWRKFMLEATKGMKATGFVSPKLTGMVLNPSPVPCPPGATPSPGVICLSPSPPPPASPAPASPPASPTPKKDQGPPPKSPPPSSSPPPSPTPATPSP